MSAKSMHLNVHHTRRLHSTLVHDAIQWLNIGQHYIIHKVPADNYTIISSFTYTCSTKQDNQKMYKCTIRCSFATVHEL